MENKGLSTVSQVPSRTEENKFTGMVTMQQAELAAVAVAAKERALIEGAYIMAKKFPRSEADSRARIIQTCSSYTFAEKAKYKKPVGNSFIIGPTIRLAEEMMRQWGHLRVEGVVLYDDDSRRIIQVSALDLQTGSNNLMQFTIEKTVERKNAAGRIVLSERTNSQNEKISIVVATEDEVMTKQNAILSKYRRNLIIQIIPSDILQDAIKKVDETIKAGITANPEAAKKSVMDNFSRLGILPSDIEKYLGHPISQVVPDEIADLKEVYLTISENEDTWINILATRLGMAPKESKVEKADANMPPRLAGEDEWTYEERVKKLKETGEFKSGDASTHSSVQKPLKQQQ